MMVGIGAVLPWITLYAGHVALRGIDGPAGLALALVGAVVVVLGVISVRSSAASVIAVRRMMVVAVVLIVTYLLVQLVITHAQLAAEPLLLAALGPGMFVAAAGASLMVIAEAMPLLRVTRPSRRSWPARMLTGAAVVGLLVAGSIHLGLAPGHLGASPVLALGFLGAGLAQATLALFLIVGGSRRTLISSAVLSVGLLGLYGIDLLIGLPFVGHAALHAQAELHAHGAAGIDLAGVIAKSAELGTIIAAVAALREHHR
ncbi:MAG TPA: hypothetical protein VM305_04755 [Candidatus Limnocylindrales bacterium]|nr:hypothetical protein [Candidatus Limnocylindrales bacterium]